MSNKVVSKLVMPRREATVSVPGYEGFEFRMCVNAPQSVWNPIMGIGLETPITVESDEPTEIEIAAVEAANASAEAANTEKFQNALAQIFIEHNGWCDFDGEPLPPASDAKAFWEAIPQELANAVIALALGEVGKLGGSIRNKKGR